MAQRSFKKTTTALLVLVGFVAILFQKGSSDAANSRTTVLNIIGPNVAHADSQMYGGVPGETDGSDASCGCADCGSDGDS